jgi:hypothetical protein
MISRALRRHFQLVNQLFHIQLLPRPKDPCHQKKYHKTEKGSHIQDTPYDYFLFIHFFPAFIF